MSPRRQLIAAFMAVAFGLAVPAPSAHSEDAGKTIYAVAYIDIVPGKEKQARRVILDHVADAKRAAGALVVDALTRDGYPSQFALLEQWQSQKARDDYASTASAQQFRAALAKLESAGVDERIQGPLFVESEKPAAIPPIVVMTHIDVIPPGLKRRKPASSNWSKATGTSMPICASMCWYRPTGRTT